MRFSTNTAILILFALSILGPSQAFGLPDGTSLIHARAVAQIKSGNYQQAFRILQKGYKSFDPKITSPGVYYFECVQAGILYDTELKAGQYSPEDRDIVLRFCCEAGKDYFIWLYEQPKSDRAAHQRAGKPGVLLDSLREVYRRRAESLKQAEALSEMSEQFSRQVRQLAMTGNLLDRLLDPWHRLLLRRQRDGTLAKSVQDHSQLIASLKSNDDYRQDWKSLELALADYSNRCSATEKQSLKPILANVRNVLNASQ